MAPVKSRTLSIVIPARGRPQMAHELVRLALSCDDARLEVIVSDNSDDGFKWIDSIDDPRFSAVRPRERLPLAANWEFAILEARGEWVTVLGTDDGLLPHRLPAYLDELASTKLDAVSVDAVNYQWPSADSSPALRAHFPRRLERTVIAFDRVEDFFRSFALSPSSTLAPKPFMPQIYMLGSIRRPALLALARRCGRLIPSRAPDWFLSLALGCELDSGLHLNQGPFVHGVSLDSTGTMQLTNPRDPRLHDELRLADNHYRSVFGNALPPTADAIWLSCWADYLRSSGRSTAHLMNSRATILSELQRSAPPDKSEEVRSFLYPEDDALTESPTSPNNSRILAARSLQARLSSLALQALRNLRLLRHGPVVRTSDRRLSSVSMAARFIESLDADDSWRSGARMWPIYSAEVENVRLITYELPRVLERSRDRGLST